MRVKPGHIDHLLGTVPPSISPDQRQRLDAHVETAQRCEARIQLLRAELQRIFELADVPNPADPDPAASSKALTVVCELDTLERVQLRVDDWLRQYVIMLTTQPFVEAYGDS
jgi:hypothetical protein